MANFFKIKSADSRHINRDLVTEACCRKVCSDHWDVDYHFDCGSLATSHHVTEEEAMQELQSFLRGPGSNDRTFTFEFEDAKPSGIRAKVTRRVGLWAELMIVLPLANDGIALAAYVMLDGNKVLEWTTQTPVAFLLPGQLH